MADFKYATIQGDGDVRRVLLQNELNAPISRVWDAVTTVDQIQHWWSDWRAGGVIEPHEGGIVKLADGSWINGKVKVWQPPYIFEFTWHETISAETDWFEQHTRSLLRIDLVAIAANKTLLNLIQFAPVNCVVGGTAGWHEFAGERLDSYIENGKVEDDPNRFAQLKTLYERDLE